jgi:hypothetical protein
MKKLAFVFGALIMGFMITSCGESVKDGMIKLVDTYFASAEADLAAIDNVADFLAYAEVMNDRSDLIDQLQEQFGEKEISDADWEVVENYMYDRATTYNKAESAKCSEFLVPAIERFENIINKMYPQYQEGTPFDEETLDEFLDAYWGVSDFSVCENVDQDLVDRVSPLFDKEDEMSETIIARMDEIWPEEEE